MPVSICEWRVRVGTFIHWIRDYEVRERRERRLKERIRRLKVLYERLKAKEGDSEEQQQDDNETGNNNKQFPGHACPHKSAGNQSSDNLVCIKDLLTSCDHCTKDLLTPNNSNHIKNLLNPPDASNNILPPPTDSSIKDLLSLNDFCKTHNITSCDINVRDQTNNYSHVQKLLRASNSCIKDLLIPSNSMEVELLLHNEDFPNDKKMQSDAKTQMRTTCFLDTSVVVSDNDRGQQTPSDLCIDDLLAPQDSLISTLLPSEDSCTSELLSQGDAFLFELLSPGDSYISELLSSGDSHNLQEKCQRKGTPRPTEDMMLHDHPCLSEMLLVQAGDVELNPGPQDRSTELRLLQESELGQLAEDIPGSSYVRLCGVLGFGYEYCKNVLTKHHLDTNEALMEIFCSWKVRQRGDVDCRKVLARKLWTAELGALQSKLLAGGYLAPETSPSATIEDTSRPLKDTMTQEQLAQCSEDLKNFYRERMCKIKTDPLDFNSILEFERIYTNLTLLRREMGRTSKTPLEYSSILSTTINGVLPKRLLVEGEGGVGKTTFCSKLAWDWVNASSQFQQFEWVLVIPMRKILKDQTIGDVVKKYLKDNNNVTPQQINDYILSHPDKVLIILDGLDEYAGDISVEDSSDICQILRLEKFNQCRVLVTTRPWRAEDIKSDEDMSRSYAFLAVTGFSAANVSTYINKYFQDDEEAGTELVKFIEDNDVIRDNMAPFPIYVAMLCILWENSDKQKRETIRRLKTFSQLFKQLITFLKHHYVSKVVKRLQKKLLDPEIAKANSFLLQIGQIAFSGLLERKLSFDEDDFITCKEALETCFGIGVLSRDRQNVSRWEQSEYVQFEAIVFPHKLFQEYVAALHIASLFDTDREQYNTSISQVMYTHRDPEEYRYLLYFVVAQGNDVGLDIIQRIQRIEEGHDSRTNRFIYYLNQGRIRPNDFLVDVTFEAYDKDTGKTVGQRIFADEQQLTIDEDMSAHTLSGYLFIMEQHGMKSLTLNGRSCGPTVSRDLADILSSSGSLSRLECYNTSLDEEFYRLMKTRASMTVEDSHSSVKELHVDHRFIGYLQRFDITVGDLFPSLEHLAISTLQTVSPSLFKQLKHPSLEVLSIKSDVDHMCLEGDEDYPVPLTGDPATLGQLISDSFPKLTSLTFKDLVVGNIRCKAILQTLRKHQHFRDIRITHCFTDDELDPLAHEIANSDSEVEVNLEHDLRTQVRYTADKFYPLTSDLMDALCHRTCVRELILEDVDADKIPDLCGREVDSKIEELECYLDLRDNQSASRCLGKFINLLPCLTDLTIDPGAFREAFYEEILNRSASSKV